MSEPDKRTRSQVALPDDILRMTQRSPMKEARTALKAQAAADSATSTSMAYSDETEDELLLSPGKHDWNSSRSKRSAPSEAQDDYSHISGSSHGRELKRVKRDILPTQGDDTNIDELSQLASVPTRNMSEPTIPTAKRRNRKRSNTTSKKPISTVTASPPPSQYTPCASPIKGRARSVPIFPVTHDIPHIDFRDFLKTPVRSRSSSQSPTKDKLRVGFPGSSSLPTIHDESTASMDVSDAPASVERDIPLIVEPPPSSSSEIIINPPTSSITLPVVPATPVTESLNRLIPMSPLTPIPETPLPGRTAVDVEDESRYDANNGWGGNLFTKKPVKPNGSTKESRLPRPMAPPPPRPLTFVPVASGSKKPMITATKVGKAGQPTNRANASDMKRPSSDKPQPSIFAVPFGSEPMNRPKVKMKEKMKPKKPKTEKPLLPLDDDEEEMEDLPLVERGEDTFGTAFLFSRKSLGPQLSISTETIEAAKMHADAGETPMDHATVMGDAQEVLRPDGGQGGDSVAKLDTLTNTGDARSNALHSLPGAEDAGPEKEQSKLEESSRSQTKSRLPLGKKRQPISTAPAGRVTRSTSRQQEKGAEASPQLSFTRTKTTATSGASLKRTASGRLKKSAPPAEEARMDSDRIEESDVLPPGSPMKTSSPIKTPSHSPVAKNGTQTIEFGAGRLTLAKTPVKSKGYVKPASSPSPSKIARATSLFIKPTITSVSHTSSTESGKPIASTSGSSLSTLSNALEKLRMPPPPRPNTTMGFNRDTLGSDDDDASKPTSKDDSALNPSGDTRPAVGLKRSVTLGAGAFRKPASSSTSNGKKLVQRPISSFWSKQGNGINAAKATGNSRFPHLGVGGPPRKTISKKSDLPVVMGSPVKGGANGDLDLTLQEIGDDEANGTGATGNSFGLFIAPANTMTGSSLFEDTEGEPSFKGKEKANSKTSNASRRVSMVSHALSQSLSSLPQTSGLGQMGPPPTPPSGKRSTSSTLPANSSASGGSPSQAGSSNALGTRSSTRIATKASQTKLGTDAPISSGRKGADAVTAAPSNPAPESLEILDDCVVFVDVKTDDGDEAGSLFGEMLEGMGAKVLTRVGQTCTHIVYKNGLMSTLTRYRLLRDPKPLVVGIGWVVKCVEERKHIDETDFLVDVEGVNVAGINKRRRSFLPKLFADALDTGDAKEGTEEDDGDKSVDVSASQEDLAPLERARRRKSMLVGPRP